MRKSILATVLCVLHVCAFAENPIVRHIRTADPSAHVWKTHPDKVFMYVSQDQKDATGYNSMDGYHAFSSSDMITWTDHGEILHSKDIPWGARGMMWAPTAAYRNGNYYLIYPHSADGTRNMRCGVAVSDKPEGPFNDIGWITGVDGEWIDPCVFEDDNGEYYLYWGIRKPKVAKLKANMKELAETPRNIDYGHTNFFEAVYVHKRDSIYYFSYNVSRAGGDYCTGTSPYGPFSYRGEVNPDQAQDHHSIIDFRGQSYFFYHVQGYKGGTNHRRNSCLEYLHYNADGTMQPVYPTMDGVDYKNVTCRVQAENYDAAKGVIKDTTIDWGGSAYVGSIEAGDWIDYNIAVSSKGKYGVEFRVAAAEKALFQIRKDGKVLVSIDVPSTGDVNEWSTIHLDRIKLCAGKYSIRIQGVKGVLNLNWMRFSRK